MITRTEAFNAAETFYPELKNKLGVRAIDFLPPMASSFIYLNYPKEVDFWLVQFASLTHDYSSYGYNDEKRCSIDLPPVDGAERSQLMRK